MDDGDVRPVPDPTVLTTDAVNRATAVSREYTDGMMAVVAERLRGIDTATRLLNETVNRYRRTERAVGNLSSLMDERFQSVQTQFQERDTRQGRESRDNKIAVDAAFAAQKEIAAKQDESNARALEKSEKSTEKIIDTLSEKIDDLKDRLVAAQAQVVAVESRRSGGQDNKAAFYAAAGLVVIVIGLIIAVITVLLR
jgi:prefoldin subunit 5